ncbi:cell division protein FtsQ/DivIB [Paenibacillus endoradicis]|uniref:cell division protein FtsQ/DivIB n=1 Tax=Paenibacillus endoradicis TaxID=2972487 RepID=UPI002158B900|nr:FtsQ-type POTRA domain-containing protein [Paenibacillus endoradicis]MCR8656005.1 FtsQ-type POTRA domain-containing protein [Paenibacillus endoradicis]MCR8658331.1 FtsQ-type POTRA domain-containing protein [Paenibacillus endoradicis]
MQSQMPVLKEPEPKKKGNKKLIAIIVILFLAILSIVFFNSTLSKITEVQITGTQFVNGTEVMNAAGLKVGDSFVFSSAEEIENNVKTLNTINKAVVTKHFPGIIKIAVTEYSVVAFEFDDKGELIALLASGASIKTNNDRLQIMDKPILTGWSKNDPYKNELMKQLSSINSTLLADISEIAPIPSVAFPDRILIYTRTKFEVTTAVSLIREKVEAMNGVIETQAPGKLTLLLADTYEPFNREDMENTETE